MSCYVNNQHQLLSAKQKIFPCVNLISVTFPFPFMCLTKIFLFYFANFTFLLLQTQNDQINNNKLSFMTLFHNVINIKNQKLHKFQNKILRNYLSKKLSNGFTSKSLIRRASSSFKHNASFVARLPTIRRHKSQSLHSPGNLKPTGGSQRGRNCPRTNEINNSAENLGRLSINAKPKSQIEQC